MENGNTSEEVLRKEDTKNSRWEFLKNIRDKVTHTDRDAKTGLKIVEKLDEGKVLLESGEILDQSGQLWGWRVYKGERNWNFEKGMSEKNPWENEEQYQNAIRDFVSNAENLEDFDNFFYRESPPPLDRFEQLAVLQVRYEGKFNEKLGSSWSRAQDVAQFWAGKGPNAVVLVKDVPKEQAVSAEALSIRYPGIRHLLGPSVQKNQSEAEITVYGFVSVDTVDHVIRNKRSSFQYKRMPALGYPQETEVPFEQRISSLVKTEKK